MRVWDKNILKFLQILFIIFTLFLLFRFIEWFYRCCNLVQDSFLFLFGLLLDCESLGLNIHCVIFVNSIKSLNLCSFFLPCENKRFNWQVPHIVISWIFAIWILWLHFTLIYSSINLTFTLNFFHFRLNLLDKGWKIRIKMN